MNTQNTSFYPGSYYLQKSVDDQMTNDESVVSGIVLSPKDDPKDNASWGYLTFQDIRRMFPYTVTILEPPFVDSLAGRGQISCISHLRERFHFSYLTESIWTDRVKSFVPLPYDISSRLTTTEAVQGFFSGYPHMY